MITVSEATWQLAQDAALLLAALRMVGVEQWPGYVDAQRLIAGQVSSTQTTELAVPRVRIVGVSKGR